MYQHRLQLNANWLAKQDRQAYLALFSPYVNVASEERVFFITAKGKNCSKMQI